MSKIISIPDNTKPHDAKRHKILESIYAKRIYRKRCPLCNCVFQYDYYDIFFRLYLSPKKYKHGCTHDLVYCPNCGTPSRHHFWYRKLRKK